MIYIVSFFLSFVGDRFGRIFEQLEWQCDTGLLCPRLSDDGRE